LELPAQTFFHLNFIEIDTVLSQPPRENIPVQQNHMHVIHGEQPGGKQACRTGSDDSYEVSPESVLNQILFSSKKRLSPSD
jgi:hypothetical protein